MLKLFVVSLLITLAGLAVTTHALSEINIGGAVLGGVITVIGIGCSIFAATEAFYLSRD